MPSPKTLSPTASRWAALFLSLGALLLNSCATSKGELPPHLLTFHVQSLDQSGRVLTMPLSGLKYHYIVTTDLSEADLQKVMLVRAQLGLGLAFYFNRDGQRKLDVMTGQYAGRMIFVLDDDEPVGAWKIDHRIQDGVLLMWVEVPQDKINDYAVDLNDSIEALQKLKK